MKPRRKGQAAPKHRPSPPQKRGDANHFLSIQLFVCVRIDWGVMGVAAIHSLYKAADLSDPAHPHSYTHNGVRSPYTGNFSPCPLALLPLSNSDMIMSFRTAMTKLDPLTRRSGCFHTSLLLTDVLDDFSAISWHLNGINSSLKHEHSDHTGTKP